MKKYSIVRIGSEYVVQAGGWAPYHAHNSYLQTLLDAGYVQ